MESRSPAARRPSQFLLYGAAIIGGWGLVALVWTPPSLAVARMQHQAVSIVGTFGEVVLFFVPWMLTTPFLLWLSKRFAVGEQHALRNIALHLGIGLLLIPLLAMAGTLLNTLVRPLPPQVSVAALFPGSMVTALYSVPTYVAVMAIGQTLGYLDRYRARERTLARAQLQALQAQIRPHFLFNALNAVAALGYKDPALADRALAELSQLLRLALEDGPEQVPLKDEIAFVQACVDVYAVLMQERMSCRIEMEDAAWNALVPRMIFSRWWRTRFSTASRGARTAARSC